MVKLYRAVSEQEKDDYDLHQLFRTNRNTLEAKQFFKSRTAVLQFVESSVSQAYNPSYKYLLVISVDEKLFELSNPIQMKLDGFDAVNIDEDDLISFNNCVKFVKQEDL